jgi:GxxExxY protein
MDLRTITAEIIGSALRIHAKLGPGLFELVYREVLADDIRRKRLSVQTERVFPVVFEGRTFTKAFRVDLVVADSVLVEVKMAQSLVPAHHTQLLTYLRLLDMRVGLLLNFGEPSLRIKRIVNGA